MTKNPILNALGALVYIVIVSSILYGGAMLKVGQNAIIAPIAMVSLFTLSAAVMGYIFLYQPIQLFLENKKQQAVRVFIRTVGAFGFMTFCIFVALFAGVFKAQK